MAEEKVKGIDRLYRWIVSAGLVFLVGGCTPDGRNIVDQRIAEARAVPPESLYVAYEGGQFGYINPDGEMVIEPRYEIAYVFRDGLAPVRVGEKWGYIDSTGRYVIEPEYLKITPFKKGFARVHVDGKQIYIKKSGARIGSQAYDFGYHFSEGLAFVMIDGKYGAIDTTGRMVIEP